MTEQLTNQPSNLEDYLEFKDAFIAQPPGNRKLLLVLTQHLVDDTFPGERTIEGMQEWLDRHGWREMPG